MKKELLEELVTLNLSQREIARRTNCSQGTVRHWLNINGLETHAIYFQVNNKILRTEKYCPKCKVTKPIDQFYQRTNRNECGGYCKNCSNDVTAERIVAVKIKMIIYKGGRCEDCGLRLEDSHYCVFDFHHINPNDKNPKFKRIKYQKWEVIKMEIDKCELLCSNCHRIKHITNGEIV